MSWSPAPNPVPGPGQVGAFSVSWQYSGGEVQRRTLDACASPASFWNLVAWLVAPQSERAAVGCHPVAWVLVEGAGPLRVAA